MEKVRRNDLDGGEKSCDIEILDYDELDFERDELKGRRDGQIWCSAFHPKRSPPRRVLRC
jgi:hypothetical protein